MGAIHPSHVHAYHTAAILSHHLWLLSLFPACTAASAAYTSTPPPPPAPLRLRQENHMNLRGTDCSKPRSHHCTPAWMSEQDSISKNKTKRINSVSTIEIPISTKGQVGLELLASSDLPTSASKRQGFTMLARLVSNSWPQAIYPPRPLKVLGLQHFGRPRWADHLRSGVQDQPGQHGETPSLLQIQKLASSLISGFLTLFTFILAACSGSVAPAAPTLQLHSLARKASSSLQVEINSCTNFGYVLVSHQELSGRPRYVI
ncbi:hypothetical protein AAY473_026416 [Plecturocebus cupreus]